MDRGNELHRTARLDLSAAVRLTERPSAVAATLRPNLPPSAAVFAGVVSFLTFGGAIVATATMMALQVQ